MAAPRFGDEHMHKRQVFVNDALWEFAKATATRSGMSTSAFVRLLLANERDRQASGIRLSAVVSSGDSVQPEEVTA